MASRLFSSYKSIVRTMSDAVLTTRCCLCSGPLVLIHHKPYPICDECAQTIDAAPLPRCLICSMPLVSEHRVCTRCRNRSYEFASNYSLFVYSGTIKELIYQYKAKDIKDLASLFAEHLAPIIHIRFPGKPVVPVPYRPVRKKKRGWDQVECIAFELKKRFNTNVLKVLRRRNSVAQKILSYEERKTNLSGRIHVRQSFKSVPSEIVLLDDIFTTGATGDECARVLKGFGAETVHMVTIAIDR